MSSPPEGPIRPASEASVEPASSRARFRRTLVRVLAVQAVALALLWLLQSRYGL